jgi:hypothetical protein
VIPPKANRKTPRRYRKALYKQRNRMERCFSKLKHFRRIATRFEKKKDHFHSLVLWLAPCFYCVNCRYNLGNRTLLPGFIDAHTHLLEEMDGKKALSQDSEMLRIVATQSTAELVSALVPID